MNQTPYSDLLVNYRALVKKIDDHILHLEKSYPDDIACKKGCDDCCKSLTLFPVEAFCLSFAFVKASKSSQDQVIQKIENQDGTCPLLINNSCALYQARPIICRTHGYPITMKKDTKIQIDFCPKNFKKTATFPKEVLLSLEQLNATLIAINQYFLESIETDDPLPDRINMETGLFLLE